MFQPVTLYRGLGLPKKAIEHYKKFLQSGTWFAFTAFTSTSANREVAVEFAYKAM